MSITLEQMKLAVECLKHHAKTPKVVKDQAEADAMNAHDAELYARVGLQQTYVWEVGDEYYTVENGQFIA
jgi:hypothetical protein